MPQLTKKPPSWFKLPEQVRKVFDEEQLRQLGESLRVKQIHPVMARPDGEVLTGGSRVRAALLVGLEWLDVIITEEPLTETQICLIQVQENIHRADLKDFEKWRACEELLRLNPGWRNKDLAEHLKLGESAVTRYLSPSRCIVEVQQALEAGMIGITDTYEISKVLQDRQADLLDLKLSGVSRDRLASHVRRQRNADKPAVRVSRIKCALPGGACVTVAGNRDGLSLDEIIENLGEVLKAAKKANEEGIDARTFQRVLADKAKAGV